jgi:arylsulfatase A-like enzyme
VFFSCEKNDKINYPNIILVMTDDQGWGQTGYYKHPILETPNLDLMAKNGLRFDRFYAGAPQCSPTRASVLTGRNNDRTGVFYHGYALNKNEKTIAQELKKHGYSTGHFGKWHLNGIRGPGVPIFEDDKYSPGQFGFDKWVSVTNFFDLNPILGDNGNITDFNGSSSDVIVNQALNFIKKNVDEDIPFLSVIWDGSPHDPFVASEEDKLGFESLDNDSSAHYGELVAFDRSIGYLRAKLREMGIEKNTIIWFCSDNGGLKNISPTTVGSLKGNKNTMWEGGLRVPAIIEWPETINPGITKYPVSTMDIFPTLLEIVGLYPSNKYSNLDGKSITNLFEANKQKRTLKIPFRFDNRGALIDNNIKLVVHDIKKLDFELYDLSKDPSESIDISKSNPQIFELMKNEFLIWNNSVENEVNKMEINHPQHWVIIEKYINYFEDWIKRPEYSKWIARALKKEGPGYQNLGPLK